MKRCSKCKEEKELSEFHKDKQKSDGLYSSCRSCMAEIYTSKEFREKRKHPRYANIKRKHKVKSFGLTVEEYESLIQKQGNKCAICNKHQSQLKKLLSIDHNHKTGKVRGLLCGNCNRGIGFLEDSPAIMRKAVDYVIQNS